MINFEEIRRSWNKKITRKEFLSAFLRTGIALGGLSYLLKTFHYQDAFAAIGEKRGMREALFYEKTAAGAMKCLLCPQGCILKEGERGFCRVREPFEGKLYSLVYELICASHVDPIEKKPLFHVLPGSRAFSIATAGCNSRCKYCQNWTISQRPPEETRNRIMTVKDLVRSALSNGCRSIAYTYTEPAIFYEYVLESSKAAGEKDILNIIITGGKINPLPLKKLCRYIDAANVDLKGFNDEYLSKICAQSLGNILETLRILKNEGVWVEITNLIVPTLNDNFDDIKRMSSWIRDNLGAGVPLHFSRFWPQNKLRSLYPTPFETLYKAREIALDEGLEFVYIGNVPEEKTESTICPGCGRTIIKRVGYRILKKDMNDGHCAFCGRKIPGIWS